ncbi:MAG: bifunctional pyr operon transcriptional regulator/uracil phosphoribosyltransferase PyrR [Planctomycetes bacterium]|nr:bifunctional pyr operon transcriptional regulator/uracil phosphoribosyltransferase PyrR [Planctomycetota bacterium]
MAAGAGGEKKKDRTTGLVVARELLDAAGIEKELARIAEEILERHPDPKDLLVVGIRTGGAHLAERLRQMLSRRAGVAVPLGILDITLYRDDVFSGLPRPEVGPTTIPVGLPGRHVVLVDDVLYTGRTIRAALDELMDYGRPKCVRLAVLVDRGNRELPIQADHAGLRVETGRGQHVRVHLKEEGEEERVVLYDKGSGP